ncbi:proline/betaine ABC transporter permease ProW|nr:proline/betaine ABC transporter permease ProW [Candidatus Pantoea persica]
MSQQNSQPWESASAAPQTADASQANSDPLSSAGDSAASASHGADAWGAPDSGGTHDAASSSSSNSDWLSSAPQP